MSKIIFYFSGTGNSYAVAHKVAEGLGGSELVPITRIMEFMIDKYKLIGFVFPVYYIHAPEIVIRLLSNVNFNPSQRIFLIITHGASWGYALSDAKSQIASAGNPTVQEFRVNMPGNHILEYGAIPPFFQKIILRKADKKINQIVRAIIHNKPAKPIPPNLLARLFKRNGDGKTQVFHDLGKKFYAKSTCQHCGLCEKICPVNNIEISNGNIIWGNRCQHCMACIQWCPHNAVAHPSLNNNRKRYTHPKISLQQLWDNERKETIEKSY